MSQEMINYNGQLFQKDKALFSVGFRGHKYGDGLFETMRVKDGVIVFLEDHYFRLMASMRMLRFEIPMNFNMQFIEEEIRKTVRANNLLNARVRLSIFRDSDGLYAPKTNDLAYTVEVSQFIVNEKKAYSVELFKDYLVNSDLLSTIKSNNRLINVLASIFAKENNFDNCILLNEHKRVVEAINGNIFIVLDDVIKTPPLTEGCIKGIMRKKVIEWLKSEGGMPIEEVPISPFDLLKASEVFITNTIKGIQPVSQYRKTSYNSEISSKIQKGIKNLI